MFLQLLSSVSDVWCKCFSCMLQMFLSGCCKSRSRCCTYCNGTHLLLTPAAAAGAPPWVTVRSLRPAGLHGAHPRAGQVTGPTWVSRVRAR
jgi:hypothetical protein